MGIATIDPHNQKERNEVTESPSLVLIGLVLTEILAFKNLRKLERNVWKCGQIRTNVRISIHFFANVLGF